MPLLQFPARLSSHDERGRPGRVATELVTRVTDWATDDAAGRATRLPVWSIAGLVDCRSGAIVITSSFEAAVRPFEQSEAFRMGR